MYLPWRRRSADRGIRSTRRATPSTARWSSAPRRARPALRRATPRPRRAGAGSRRGVRRRTVARRPDPAETSRIDRRRGSSRSIHHAPADRRSASQSLPTPGARPARPSRDAIGGACARESQRVRRAPMARPPRSRNRRPIVGPERHVVAGGSRACHQRQGKSGDSNQRANGRSLRGRSPVASAGNGPRPKRQPVVRDDTPQGLSHGTFEADEQRVADERVPDRHFVEVRQRFEETQIFEVEIVPGVHAQTAIVCGGSSGSYSAEAPSPSAGLRDRRGQMARCTARPAWRLPRPPTRPLVDPPPRTGSRGCRPLQALHDGPKLASGVSIGQPA